MNRCSVSYVNRGGQIFIAALGSDCTLPNFAANQRQFDITVDNGGDVAKGSSSPITIAALPAGLIDGIRAGNWLGFVNQTTGRQILTRVEDNVPAGGTILTPGDGHGGGAGDVIADGSIAKWPLLVDQRESMSINQTPNTEASITFGDNLYERQNIVSISTSIDLSGNLTPFDPAFQLIQYAIREALNLYVWLYIAGSPTGASLDPNYEYDIFLGGNFVPSGNTLDSGASAVSKFNLSIQMAGIVDILAPRPI